MMCIMLSCEWLPDSVRIFDSLSQMNIGTVKKGYLKKNVYSYADSADELFSMAWFYLFAEYFQNKAWFAWNIERNRWLS